MKRTSFSLVGTGPTAHCATVPTRELERMKELQVPTCDDGHLLHDFVECYVDDLV